MLAAATDPARWIDHRDTARSCRRTAAGTRRCGVSFCQLVVAGKGWPKGARGGQGETRPSGHSDVPGRTAWGFLVLWRRSPHGHHGTCACPRHGRGRYRFAMSNEMSPGWSVSGSASSSLTRSACRAARGVYRLLRLLAFAPTRYGSCRDGCTTSRQHRPVPHLELTARQRRSRQLWPGTLDETGGRRWASRPGPCAFVPDDGKFRLGGNAELVSSRFARGASHGRAPRSPTRRGWLAVRAHAAFAYESDPDGLGPHGDLALFTVRAALAPSSSSSGTCARPGRPPRAPPRSWGRARLAVLDDLDPACSQLARSPTDATRRAATRRRCARVWPRPLFTLLATIAGRRSSAPSA